MHIFSSEFGALYETSRGQVTAVAKIITLVNAIDMHYTEEW